MCLLYGSTDILVCEEGDPLAEGALAADLLPLLQQFSF